jgi:hypothetical protein
MKIIGKLVLLGIFISVLFLYRNELSGVLASFKPTSKSTIENASSAGKRKHAYDAYELDDTEYAIDLLEEYLTTVNEELSLHQYQSDGLVTTRRDVICELSSYS